MVFKVCKLFAYFMLRRFAMEATVAERGQITLPKAVRDALGLSKGTILKVELEGGRIILRKSVDDAISRARGRFKLDGFADNGDAMTTIRGRKPGTRSEERRVGKAWGRTRRSRGAPDK